MRERNLNIEVLRGILMIWIVLFHYTTRFKELFGYNVLSYEFEWGGIVGVTFFFFILSGYLFYAGMLNMGKSSLTTITKFCVNKYWRLYPAYLLSIIFIYVVYHFIDLPGRECSLNTFIVNILFIIHPGFPYVDSAHWFISVLIRMQIISAFFLLFKPSIRSGMILIFEILIVSLLILTNILNIPVLNEIESILSLNNFLKFLIGYNFYMILSTQDKIKYLHIVLVLLIISYYCYSINNVLIVVWSIITYLVLQNKHIPVYNCYKPIIIVGKYSFVWYLVHQNIGFAIINKLNSIGFHNEISIIIPMFFTFAIAVFIQTIVDRLPNKLFSI